MKEVPERLGEGLNYSWQEAGFNVVYRVVCGNLERQEHILEQLRLPKKQRKEVIAATKERKVSRSSKVREVRIKSLLPLSPPSPIKRTTGSSNLSGAQALLPAFKICSPTYGKFRSQPCSLSPPTSSPRSSFKRKDLLIQGQAFLPASRCVS